MKQVYFATSNKGKVKSLKNGIEKYGIEIIHEDMALPESRSYDLYEIAKEKVRFAYSKLNKPCIALDAGFYINALNGFPRTYVNFTLETIGIEGLLKLAKGLDRTCAFRDVFVYKNGLKEFSIERLIEGTLPNTPRGVKMDYHWSVLCKIFIPKGLDKSLGEMSFEEFNQWRTTLNSPYQKLAEEILKS